jgi:hypothetical protein
MKQVIHIFRKDVRHLWKEIAVSLTLLAVYVWSEPATWFSGAAASGLSGLATRSSIAELVTELLPISWWLLVLRVVQDEALVGDRQFWVTRPYEWKKLLAAKVLFGAAFVSVPLLLAQFSLLQLAAFPPTLALVPGILWMQLTWALILLTIATLATVTTGIGQMALVMLGVGAYFAITSPNRGVAIRAAPNGEGAHRFGGRRTYSVFDPRGHAAPLSGESRVPGAGFDAAGACAAFLCAGKYNDAQIRIPSSAEQGQENADCASTRTPCDGRGCTLDGGGGRKPGGN